MNPLEIAGIVVGSLVALTIAGYIIWAVFVFVFLKLFFSWWN